MVGLVKREEQPSWDFTVASLTSLTASSHLKHGARIDQRKIKVIIEKQEIGQRKWLQKP